MSKFEIKMPKLGESITEGTIISWSVKVGDMINEDDVLFEVNTAKVSAEIPSPVTGKILEILFKEGDTVSVGTIVAIVELNESGELNEDSKTEEKGESVKSSPASAIPEEKTVLPEAAAIREEKNTETIEDKWYSPVVLSKAKEAGIDKEELDSLPGTGYEGRLSKRDIDLYISNKTKAASSPVRRDSSETEVGSEVRSASVTTSPDNKSKTIPAEITGGDKVIPMDVVRRIIADRMIASKKISPHVTNVIEVDVTKLVRWREQNKEVFKKREGISLTYMPAIVQAATNALKEYPRVNSSVDGYNIIEKKHINIGVAVSLNDGNLIVPVIKDADQLSLTGLALSISNMANKARSNKLTPDEIQGGTFTVTNFGSFKSAFGAPIINQPEVAILGVGVIEKKPAVIETPEGDAIAIRHKMFLSLSYDHRVIDGMLGGNFLYRIAGYLENWNV